MKEQENIKSKISEVVFRDTEKQYGFTQISNLITEDSTLSDNGFRLYVLLNKYAMNKNFCFPGQARLAREMGKSRSSVARGLLELKSKGLITVKNRGLNKTNLYIIESLSKIYSKKLQTKLSDVSDLQHPDVSLMEYQVAPPMTHKEYKVEKEKINNIKLTLNDRNKFSSFSLEAQELANTFEDQPNIKFYQSIVNKRDKGIIHKDDLFTAIDITRRIIRTNQVDGKPPIKKQGALFNSKLKELVTKRKYKNNLAKLDKEISKLANSKSICDENKPNANTRRNFLLNQAQEMDKKEPQISRNTS